MGEHPLESLLRKLESEERDDDKVPVTRDQSIDPEKIEALQGAVEKVLQFLVTAVQATDHRLVDLQIGVNNVISHVATQVADLVGRLKTLPGLEDLQVKEPPKLQLESGAGQVKIFMQDLSGAIQQAAARVLAGKEVDTCDDIKKEAEAKTDAAAELTEILKKKEQELLEKETYLARLADQLSEKELELEERERTCELVERQILALTGQDAVVGERDDITGDGSQPVGQNAGPAREHPRQHAGNAGIADGSQGKQGTNGGHAGETLPSDELEDLSRLSESILDGQPMDLLENAGDEADSDEEELIRKILEENEDEDDDAGGN